MELAEKVSRLMPRLIDDLAELVRIPSVGFPGFDPANVRASAEATAELLERSGLQEVRLIEIPGGHPAVFGRVAAPDGAPTVLLYAHHDVQPEGPADQWQSPPFEPAIRDGRMYGRGTCDDKAGIVMHAAALQAFEGAPPLGVKVLVEGEEECTSDHLEYLVGEHAELLAADAVVIADAGMWQSGVPGLTTSIRGVVSCTVEVRVAEKALHSGEFGGAAPDAIMSLARIISSLHDDRGDVAVPGLIRATAPGPAFTEESYRKGAGLRPGVELIGDDRPLMDRLLRGPSVTVVGIDAPSVKEASYQLVPSARALITMRIAPTEDPKHALASLMGHIENSVPWGVECKVQADSEARGFEAPRSGVIYDAAMRSMRDAWGVDPVDMGMGGSVPLVPVIAGHMPDAVVLMTGPGDERCGAHSLDESVDLRELERACLAEALFLGYMAEVRA